MWVTVGQQPFLSEVTALTEAVGQVLPLADRLDQLCFQAVKEEGGGGGVPAGRTMDPYDVSIASTTPE